MVQVAVQASGAIAVYLLACDLLEERWPAVALAVVLLLNPTYQFLTWEFFHPDALAIALLLFAYWRRGRIGGAGSCCSRSLPRRARRTSRSCSL